MLPHFYMEKKRKVCSICGQKDYIFGHKRCRKCYSKLMVEFQQAKEQNRTSAKNLGQYVRGDKPVLKKKLPESTNRLVIKGLKAKLRKLVHDYVKDYYTIDGVTRCYTCGYNFSRSEIEAGHWQHGSNAPATRFEYEFIKPQCKSCNQFKSGQAKVFEERLRLELGDKKVNDFIYKSKQIPDFTEEILKKKIKIIQQLNKEL